jgi:hypothetical protein
MHLLVEAEWGLPREQDVGVVGYGEFRPPTPTYPAAVITNTLPAPEATEATQAGTVCELAMPGEGAAPLCRGLYTKNGDPKTAVSG